MLVNLKQKLELPYVWIDFVSSIFPSRITFYKYECCIYAILKNNYKYSWMNDESVASNKNGRRSVLNSSRPPIGVEMNEMHGGQVAIFSIQLIN